MPKLGLKGKLYLLTTGTRATWGAADSNGLHAGPAPSNLDEATNVQNLSWSEEDAQAEVPTRGNNGYNAKLPALTDQRITFNMVYDAADADLLRLIKAKIGKTSIAAAALDDDKATVGTIGIWADYHVFTVNKTEELREGQMIDFVLEPALSGVAPEWIKVTA